MRTKSSETALDASRQPVGVEISLQRAEDVAPSDILELVRTEAGMRSVAGELVVGRKPVLLAPGALVPSRSADLIPFASDELE